MKFTKLFVQNELQNLQIVKEISSKLQLPLVLVQDPKDVFESADKEQDPIGYGKRILYLTRNKGRFIKDCPGTRSYTCCGYQILHIGSFCTMDCAYCILQSYFHPPICQFFVNHDDLFSELDHFFSQATISRFGTGEFTDSLIWTGVSDLNTRLVRRFAFQSKSVLELKTKTAVIAPFESIDHNRKTIMSWSLNTPTVVKAEESGTAAIAARLEAAQKCASWGYPIAFHFDPVVIYDGCEKDYERVIRQIFKYVSAENIVWISIGTFRFMPQLKSIIAQRFPDSDIIYGEFIRGLDNKMRYFKPLRMKMYRHMVDAIRGIAPHVTVYFCMEDDEVWKTVMGYQPADRGGLSAILDDSAIKHCGIKS